MAWALKFDGENDNAKVGVSGLPIIGYYDITFKFNQLSSNSAAKICDSYDGFNRFDINMTGGFFDLRDYAKVQVDGVDNGEVFTGVPVDIRIYRDVTCSDQGDKNLGTLMSRYTSSFFAGGELISVDVKNGIGGGDLFLDATASSHAAGTPILTDTVGDNDATGVNMSTDGSAWVDLGGTTPDELVFSDSTVQPSSDSIALALIDNLVFIDSVIQPISDSVILQNIGNLSFSSSTVQPISDAIVITSQNNIVLSSSTAQPTSDSIILQDIGQLNFSDSLAQPTSELMIIKNITQLMFSDGFVQPISDIVAIENAGQLIFNDSLAQPSSDILIVELYTELSFSDSMVQPTSDSINITKGFMPFFGNNDLLMIDNTIDYHLTNNTTEYRIK